MAVRTIVKFGDPVLSTPTREVTSIDATVRTLVQDMIETMHAAPGVGLAANQVGVGLRVAVIDVTAAGAALPRACNKPINLLGFAAPNLFF